MLLAEVVATSAAVGATRSRSAKVAALAGLIGRADGAEVGPLVSFLCGEPRQGRIGVGWATLVALDASPAAGPAPVGSGEASVTVNELDRLLGELAALSGPGSVGARRSALAATWRRLTGGEIEFVRRLLVGELHQGALAGLVTEAVAVAAGVPPEPVRRATMLSGDLARVATLAVGAHDALTALDTVTLQVLRPVLPMLASTATGVDQALAELGPSSVEWKLDGARIQAHRAGREIRLFTRNGNDVTGRLPAVAAVVAALAVDAVVLDGEVLGLDDEQRPDRFQDTMSRFGRHDGGGGGLRPVFFDVLHVDGLDLLDRPLADRREVLGRIAGPWRVPAVLTDDPAVATDFLAAALDAGHEGVMVKAIGSRYEAGRRGGSWRKVKPVHTFDLVVLAAEWGHGRRTGMLSNLHLGARGPAGFVMVGKTFKGLTDALLAWQTERFAELAVAERRHVVELRPELVVEIAVDGVQASTRYPGGVALRFARVRRYRPDKAPEEADTIEAVRALLRRGGGRAGAPGGDRG